MPLRPDYNIHRAVGLLCKRNDLPAALHAADIELMEADIKAHLPQTFLRHLADDLAPCAEDDLRAAGRQPVNNAQRQTDCTAHNSNFSREIKHLTNGRQTLKRTCGHLKHHFLIHQIILFLCIFA